MYDSVPTTVQLIQLNFKITVTETSSEEEDVQSEDDTTNAVTHQARAEQRPPPNARDDGMYLCLTL